MQKEVGIQLEDDRSHSDYNIQKEVGIQLEDGCSHSDYNIQNEVSKRAVAACQKDVAFVTLEEQAPQYFEMVSYIESGGGPPGELSAEGQNLLSDACNSMTVSRRVARRIINGAERLVLSRQAKQFCVKIEGELQKVYDAIIGVFDNNLIPAESKVFYQRMKAD